MNVLWFASLALAAPPRATQVVTEPPSPLVKLTARAQADVDLLLGSIVGHPATAIRLSADSPLAASALVDDAEEAMPGTDFVFFLVDTDDDGFVDMVDASSLVFAPGLRGRRQVLERPILLDTNGDGKVDRLSLYQDAPAPVRTARR